MHSISGEHERAVLAIDPGRVKCGVAVVAPDGTSVARRVVPVDDVTALLPQWVRQFDCACVVLGDSTSSAEWAAKITACLPELPIVVVDERGSTLEARPLYWQAHPPRGWRRWVPLSLQTPPEPVDDFAAVVLARRYFRL